MFSFSETKISFLQKHKGQEQVDKQKGPQEGLQSVANPKPS